MFQDLLQLSLGLPPTSGKEDLSSSLVGEASRKVIAFLMKKGHIELAFPFEYCPFPFFITVWKCEQIT